MTSVPELFKNLKALHIKNFLSKDLCDLLVHNMFIQQYYTNANGDMQCPNALSFKHNHMSDTILEKMWVSMEHIIGEELIPTYAYSRIYSNGDILEKHTDRESCEISVTIQLSRTHNYVYPIYMGNTRYDLAIGDAVIYSGCDIEHWRDACDGPENYQTGQLFLHYVRANGNNASWAGDRRGMLENSQWYQNTNWINKHPFIRNRMLKFIN